MHYTFKSPKDLPNNTWQKEMPWLSTYLHISLKIIYRNKSCFSRRRKIVFDENVLYMLKWFKIHISILLKCIATPSFIDGNAVKCLQERKYIVIRPADIGGAIVVWRRDLYFQDLPRHISNTDVDYPTENGPTLRQHDIITFTVT